MLDKKKTIIITVLILIVGFVVNTVLSNQKQHISRKSGSQKTEQVKTLQIKTSDMSTEISVSGRLNAYNKIELYAEVSGVLVNSSKRFEAGKSYNKGEILVKIDDSVYRNNLLAQKSSLLNQMTLMLPDLRIDYPEAAVRWEKFLSEFELNKKLSKIPEPENSQEKYYIASRNIYNQYYSVKSMEATLDKYTIRAPYNGEVIEANLTPGSLVRNGQKIGEFMSSVQFEMEAPVALPYIKYVEPGSEVTLTSEDVPGEFKGVVKRLNKSIDQNTQTIMTYIISSDERLKDGMYLTAHIKTSEIKNTVSIPRYLLNKDDEVYVVENKNLTLVPVAVVKNDGDNAIVTGLSDGDVILNQEYDNSLTEKLSAANPKNEKVRN